MVSSFKHFAWSRFSYSISTSAKVFYDNKNLLTPLKIPRKGGKSLPCMFNIITYSDSHLLSLVIVEASSRPFSTFALSIRRILKWLPIATQFDWSRENNYATIFSFNKMRSGRTAILRPITVFESFKFSGK